MIAEKLLISLLIKAMAMEKAPVTISSKASSAKVTSRPVM